MANPKITAGRDVLGDFAPEFARYNDDILFGEVWASDTLSPKERSMLTVAALMTNGIFDSSLAFHLGKAKENGVAKSEIAAMLTHLSFYSGWPKAWAAFRVAKEIWTDADSEESPPSGAIFPLGEPNDAYAKYFTGQSYLKMLTTEGVNICNVTFEPGCRNNWHIHKADEGGGQILLCTNGIGWYQEWNKEAQELHPGDAVVIPAGVKHWHGAAKDGWFAHLAIEVPGVNAGNEWLEAVEDAEYDKLIQTDKE